MTAEMWRKLYTKGECADGFFIEPTVFDGCTGQMTIVKEEIFGPVAAIQTFKTEDEAIALAALYSPMTTCVPCES